MTDTASRLEHRLRGVEQRNAPRGPSIGARFASSGFYARAREQRLGIDAPLRPEQQVLCSADELTGLIRQRAQDPTGIIAETSGPYVALPPMSQRVPQLVENTPVKTAIVTEVDETSQLLLANGVVDINAATATAAAQIPGTQAVYSGQPVVLDRWGTSARVQATILQDPGQAESTVENLFTRAFMLGLEADMLVGDGTQVAGVQHLKGLLGTAGGARARGTDYRADALINAAARVKGAGFVAGQVTAVLHPTDASETFLERDTAGAYVAVDDVFDRFIDNVVLSNALPVGTGVVGAFFEGGQLFVKDGLTFEIGTMGDDFLKGMITMQLVTRLTFWTRLPNAFIVVTGL